MLLHVVRDGEAVAGPAADCVTQLLPLVAVLQVVSIKLPRNLKQIVLQVAEGIRLEVGEEGDVVLVWELITEGQCVQGDHHRRLVFVLVAGNRILVELVVRCALSHLRLQVVPIVADVFTAAPPLVGAVLSVLLDAVDERLHPYLVTALVLLQVHDVELVLASFADVPDSEVVPLAEGAGVEVEVDVAVILVLV